MIRITGGKFRGRSIESPPKSKDIRPTTSLMRESVFSMMQARLDGARFLDLFAGSGIMGVEALSRGAGFVLAVDRDRVQVQMIRRNYAKLSVPETTAKVIPLDVMHLLTKTNREEAFDIIFADPPYGFDRLAEMTRLIKENGWLKPGGMLLVEHGIREPELAGFTRKQYGESVLSFLAFSAG